MPSAFIIGAGPGLGTALAQRFVANGYDVVVGARNRERIEALASNLSAQGAQAHGLVVDVADEASLADGFARMHDLVGVPDVVVFNPRLDYAPPYRASDISPEEVEQFFARSTLAAIRCTRQVLPAMIERGSGALLYTMGASALFPAPAMAPVGVATAGLLNYARVLGTEVAERGVWAGAFVIAARIASGTPASPDAVADAYWRFFTERPAEPYVFKLNA